MDAFVHVSHDREMAIKDAGEQVPQPVAIRALIDTGASSTCIDPTVLSALGLTPTGNIQINTPSTGNTPVSADQYDVSIHVPPGIAGDAILSFNTVPVICAELLQSQGFHALIGRDILAHCLFTYNGTNRSFTLAY